VRYYGVQNEVKSYLNRLQSEDGIEVSLGTVKTLNDRVEALKKSGVWSQYGLGFNDGDADRYFQRATVRDAIGRFEVCLFVRGMKTLGLWQNMVSWPMRSYQNVGTGSIVYSLGGLGVYNGSMVNSPTWGANGVTVNTGQSITLATSIICPELVSTGFVVQPLTNSGENYIFSDQSINGLFLNHHWTSQGRHLGCVPAGLNTSYGCGQYSIQSGFFNDLSLKFLTFQRIIAGTYPNILANGVLKNGGSQGTDLTPAINRTMTNLRCIKDSLYSIIILGSNFNMEIVRPLYKLTLGSNLGLP